MNEVPKKSSKGAYTVNSFPENLIIFFENPHSNFQSCVVGFEGCAVGFEGCVVGFEMRDDAVLNVDFSI